MYEHQIGNIKENVIYKTREGILLYYFSLETLQL